MDKFRKTGKEIADDEEISEPLLNAVSSENVVILKYVSGILLASLVLALIYSLLTRDPVHYTNFLIFNVIVSTIVFFISQRQEKMSPFMQRNLIGIVEIIIYSVSVIGGTVMCDHDSDMVTFAVLLILVPGMFLEKTINKVTLATIALSSFIVLDILIKPWECVMHEVPNVIILWFIGIGCSLVTMKKRVGNLRGRIVEEEYAVVLEEYNDTLGKKYLMSLEDIIDERDHSTGGHIKRTRDVVAMLTGEIKNAGDMDMSDNKLNCIIKAAPLHDIGKVAVADAILCKPGKLTDDEFTSMKEHTVEGAKFLESVFDGTNDNEMAEVAKNIARYHHERFDGMGYPCGLAGENIPIEARIMAIADVYDSLVSKRCYKEGLSFDKAFEIIEAGMGSHFDPSLNKYFLKCRNKLEKYYALEAK